MRTICPLAGKVRRDKSTFSSETIGRWNAKSVLDKYGLSISPNRDGLLWSRISGVDGTHGALGCASSESKSEIRLKS